MTAILKTFELFPKLPADLRLKIWEADLPYEPQIIRLLFHPKSGSITARPPALLQVNLQSRDAALKHYEKFKSSDGKRAIYLSSCHDMLHIDAHCQGCRGPCLGDCHNLEDIRAALADFDLFVANTARLAIGSLMVSCHNSMPSVWKDIVKQQRFVVFFKGFVVIPGSGHSGSFLEKVLHGNLGDWDYRNHLNGVFRDYLMAVGEVDARVQVEVKYLVGY